VASALINVPPRAKRGEIIEIKTLISHTMETGFRRTQLGAVIPRDIIRRFVCTYNGTEVFSADLHPAIAANPFIVFSTIAIESGTLVFSWTGDNGFSVTESATISVGGPEMAPHTPQRSEPSRETRDGPR
jgi:sulfur-oxidizing protein SoxZ